MSEPTSGEQTSDLDRLAALADDFARRYRGGEHPSLEEYTQKYPDLASQIRELFPGLLMMEKSSLDATLNIAPQGERVGALIGRYKLLERIGEGGFGVVFMAEQQHPVRRKVALKVLKPGVDTKQVIARFEAERQALAMMDHENIAKVLDAGATETGRPYFVMELVRGTPITNYCDTNQLSPKDRLKLFIQVCRAVQHAHTKGIIHRDIKPTNVLVTLHDGVPVPKVIDFGVARATGNQALTERTLFTQFAQMVGTPLYMSPEQAEMSGLDMDTRSDIYSLGVLLYELLTGTTPFDKDRLRQAAHEEVRRIIREEEPPKPSTRISTLGERLATVSANCKTDSKRLGHLVRGDLDWIVMKCLEKDRTRAYETASGLSSDVERYLAQETVQACPPTAFYRLQKFARRNKRMLATATLLALMLLATAGTAGWAIRNRAVYRAEAERERAAQSAKTDQEVDSALLEAAFLRDRGDWPKASVAVKRAEWLLASGRGSDANRERVRAMGTDLAMVSRLEAIRLGEDESWTPRLVSDSADQERRMKLDLVYNDPFKEYGIDVVALDASVAAQRIRNSAIREPLVGALEDWMWCKLCAVNRRQDGLRVMRNNSQAFPPERVAAFFKDVVGPLIETKMAEYEHLRVIVDLAEPDPWSRRVRDPAVQQDRPALEKLAARPAVADQRASAAMLLARVLIHADSMDTAVEVLYAVQRRAPEDVLVNRELASFPTGAQEERIGFMRAALAVRPQSAALYSDLASLLDGEQALPFWRKAFELNPDFQIHGFLESAMMRLRDWDGILAFHHRAIALRPQDGRKHARLASVYGAARQWDKALAAYRDAARLSPDSVEIQNALAWLLATCPDPALRGAAEAVERAERVSLREPANQDFWTTLGVARYREGDWRGSIEALDRANVLRKNFGITESLFIAMALWQLGDHDRAHEWYDRGTEHKEAFDRGDSWSMEFVRFRTEAAELLGIANPPPLELDLEQAFESAGAFLLAGDATGYRRLCAELLERAHELKCREEPWRREYLLPRLCLLAAGGYADPMLSSRMLSAAVEKQPHAAMSAWHWHTRGLSRYRDADYLLAVQRFEASMEADPSWPGQPLNWLGLALANYRLGRADESRQWLEKATQVMDKVRPEDAGSRSALGMDPHDWLASRLLRREAEALIRAAPFQGTPAAVPGTVQAEDFDEGGEGVAYHLLRKNLLGSAQRYRAAESVAVDGCADDRGHNVSNLGAGEWLAYTVQVADEGSYLIDLRVASHRGGRIHIEFGTENRTALISIPATGGWQEWQTVSIARPVRLKAGRQVMRIVFDQTVQGEPHICNINWVKIRRDAVMTP